LTHTFPPDKFRADPSGDPSAGKDKLAQEWQTHTARALRTAIKDARQQRKAAANE